MTSRRSLDQLERETERNRAVLIETVDALRSAVLGEVEAVRRKTSLDYLGSEIRSRVRANPLRAAAIGAGLSVPLWKMGRRIPMPLVLVGAGVALARPKARKVVSGVAADLSDRAARVGARSSDALSGAWGSAREAGSSAGQRTVANVDAAQNTLRDVADDALARAGDMASTMAGAGGEAASTLAGKGAALLQDGSDRLVEAREQAGRTVARTRTQAAELFNENPLAVAGAGLALGALLAAILPATRTEGRLADKVVPDLKGKASDLVDRGYEAARAAAGSLYDGAVGRAREQGLSPDGARDAASDLGERVGAVVDAAIGPHGTGHPDDTVAHS